MSDDESDKKSSNRRPATKPSVKKRTPPISENSNSHVTSQDKKQKPDTVVVQSEHPVKPAAPTHSTPLVVQTNTPTLPISTSDNVDGSELTPHTVTNSTKKFDFNVTVAKSDIKIEDLTTQHVESITSLWICEAFCDLHDAILQWSQQVSSKDLLQVRRSWRQRLLQSRSTTLMFYPVEKLYETPTDSMKPSSKLLLHKVFATVLSDKLQIRAKLLDFASQILSNDFKSTELITEITLSTQTLDSSYSVFVKELVSMIQVAGVTNTMTRKESNVMKSVPKSLMTNLAGYHNPVKKQKETEEKNYFGVEFDDPDTNNSSEKSTSVKWMLEEDANKNGMADIESMAAEMLSSQNQTFAELFPTRTQASSLIASES